jgi:hypothetical protein
VLEQAAIRAVLQAKNAVLDHVSEIGFARRELSSKPRLRLLHREQVAEKPSEATSETGQEPRLVNQGRRSIHGVYHSIWNQRPSR